MSIKISVIIPTRQEKINCHLLRMAERYPQQSEIEYIVVDWGTDSEVFRKIERSDFRVVNLPNSTRAARLNKGIEISRGEIILCHHPRSLLDKEALNLLIEKPHGLQWGGFTHRFDEKGLGYLWTSFYSNFCRPNLFKIVYLDHCIYFRRDLLTRPLPDIPIFEDTELSKVLGKKAKPKILKPISETSAVRFRTNGFWKQAITNQIMKIGYHFGYSRKRMNDAYEKKLNLN